MNPLGNRTRHGMRRGRMGLGARFCALALLCAAGPAAADSAGTNATPDKVVSRFRLGPFFEYRATSGGGTFWALRPFYSKLQDPVSDTRVTDVLWPLSTFHRDREQSWWRVLLAYGSDDDVTREDAAWKRAVFPFYFQGRTRQGEDYWALFPIYGHLPHVLLMDDIDFVLFPLYLDYEINRVERRYYVWPLFSRVDEEPGVTRSGLFPIYGSARRRGATQSYAFWPFWTSAVYEGENNPGSSWMLWPLYGRVDREKEQQRLVAPPFFSWAETDSAERWRMPWPFYETLTTKTERKRSYWPFYGDAARDDERRWYAAWPLIRHFSLTSGDRRTEHSRFFPFYLKETVYERDEAGEERAVSSYTRYWPFYAREAREGHSRSRVLALNLIRHSGAIERNWAPFWTLYERLQEGGTITHDALWGLIQIFRHDQPEALP